MKIAVYGKVVSEQHGLAVRNLFDRMIAMGWETIIYHHLVEVLLPYFPGVADLKQFSTQEEVRGVDFVFSLGGDGTILDAVTIVRDSGIPLLGINTGRLGFLSSISISEIEEAFRSIASKTYYLDKRSLLQLETKTALFGSQNFAMNEITIHKKDTASMVVVHAYLDGKFLNSYWADGLIVSTSTGSTAYSLSCGGPILLPGNDNFVINPVAPHNLNVRPFVISENSLITLRVEGRSDSFLVSLDSRSETINPNLELHISKAKFKISLVRLPDHSFLDTLRKKLNWGLDARSVGQIE